MGRGNAALALSAAGMESHGVQAITAIIASATAMRQDKRMKLFTKKNGPRQAASPAHKVIIAGPGRSGTTLLVQLLTDLGFDTGFNSDSMHVSEISHAGLEQGLFAQPHRKAPLTKSYVIKSPLISDNLQLGCERDDLVVEHVYIPIRPINEVALSRARVSDISRGHPGGLDKALDIEGQMNRTARSLYTLLDTVTRYDLPHTFIAFPRLTEEPQYLYRKLDFLCSDIDYDQFEKAFETRVRPDLVHSFEGGPT
ncbi:MAG: hypothetical protein ABJL54_05725 [Halioglobus sp.]